MKKTDNSRLDPKGGRSGLRGAVHKYLVKTGFIEAKWGKMFDRAFENRQSADYLAMWRFEHDQVEAMIEEAEGFVDEMARLLAKPGKLSADSG